MKKHPHVLLSWAVGLEDPANFMTSLDNFLLKSELNIITSFGSWLAL